MTKYYFLPILAFAFCVACHNEEPEAVTRGRVHYEQYCGLCHGVAGEGYISPRANALNNPDFLRSATTEFLYMAITQGRPGTQMSPFGKEFAGPLDDDMVSDLIAFMRYWDRRLPVILSTKTIEGNIEDGKAVYENQCELCHGKEGEGAIGLSLNNPVFLNSASDGFLKYGVEKGRRNTSMVAYEDRLSEKSINDLVALMRSWTRPIEHEPTGPALEGCTELNTVGDKGNGEPQWEADGDLYESNESVFKAYEAGKELIMLDARPGGDYLWDHITGAISMPFFDVEKCYSVLPKDTWIVTYCACPHNESEHAANVLKENGYDKVRVLNEGYIEWKEAGYPFEEPSQQDTESDDSESDASDSNAD